MVQAGMLPPNVAKELLGFTVRGFKIGRSLEEVLDEMGGDDEQNPEMEQMKGQMQQQMQQQMEQAKQQMTEYVQKMQQDNQQKVQQLEGKLFEAQKGLAITKAVNTEKSQATIAEAKIKGNVTVETQYDKNELMKQLAMFQARLDAILKIPEQRDMTEVINVTREALESQQKEHQGRIDSLNSELAEARSSVTDIAEYMKKPAKIIRDKNGRVSGATRD